MLKARSSSVSDRNVTANPSKDRPPHSSAHLGRPAPSVCYGSIFAGIDALPTLAVRFCSSRVRSSASQQLGALCHVWTAPSWQELSSRLQHWSVQPCVRPFNAVHMTAGHNALRGSGPDQTLAFDNAMARVGCPDRRIDRLCITCCSPSQPSHHAGCPARSRLPRKCDGILISFTLSHHGPGHPRNLVGKRDGGDLGGAPA